MFVSLQHHIHFMFTDDVVEHPSLDEVVHAAANGVKRMVQNHNLPFRPTLFQLFLQPPTLCPQIEKLPIAVQTKKLYILIPHGEHLILTHHRVEEVGMNEGKTTFQFTDYAFQVVVVASDGQYWHRLPHTVEGFECLTPIGIGGAFCQVATTYEEFRVGISPECLP